MKKSDEPCVPMKCAVCETCCARLYRGKPSGVCAFGGPFDGYVRVS